MRKTPISLKAIWRLLNVKYVWLALATLGSMIVYMGAGNVFKKEAYMGAEFCGSCHQSEYLSWKNSAHASASIPKSHEDYKDISCQKCHDTGAEGTEHKPYLKGVQCEACHGPGYFYASIHMKKNHKLSKLLFEQKPSADSCKKCHNSSLANFDLNHSMKKIQHWKTLDHKNSPHGMAIENPETKSSADSSQHKGAIQNNLKR